MRPTRRLQVAVALACVGVVLTGCSAKKKSADVAATSSTSADSSVESSDASSSDFDITLVPATPTPDDQTSTEATAAPSSSSPAVKPTAKPTPSKTPSPTPTQVVAAGRVFAFIKKVDVATRALTYDQAQFLTGDAAVKAAAEDKQTLDTDYYIRNVNKKLRTAPIAPDGTLLGSIALTSKVDLNPVTIELLSTFVGTEAGSQVGFWVTIDGKGRITRVEEQYVP